MRFFEGVFRCSHMDRQQVEKLKGFTQELLKNWNEPNNESWRFLVSKVTATSVSLLCATINNSLMYEFTLDEMKNYIGYCGEEVGIEALKNGVARKHYTELTLDAFVGKFNDRTLKRLYPDIFGILSIIGIGEERTFFTEKLLPNNFRDKPCTAFPKYIPREELKRIHYTIEQKDSVIKPVHYLVFGRGKKEISDMLSELVTELQKAYRLSARRYIKLSAKDVDSIDKCHGRIQNFGIFDGGMVLVDLDCDSEDTARTLIKSVYSEENGYLGSYTAIFTIPCTHDHYMELVKEICDKWPFITISDPCVSYERTVERLGKIASENDVVIQDSDYPQIIKKGNEYSLYELKDLFRKWYLNKYNIMHYYPEYLIVVSDYFSVVSEGTGSIMELNSLIGLDSVKALCKQIINYYALQKLRKEKVPSLKDIGMNMVFQGNPGTAKTTVARIMAKILKEKGILSKGNLVEVGREELVSEYVGQTAANVKRYFEKAKGGVLFIDEAYALYDEKGQGAYGTEAINTIVHLIENYREDLAVIFAGYKDDMKRFIKKNAGLSSRISFYVDFPDYSVEELYEILKKMARENYYVLKEDVYPAFVEVVSKTNTSVGNGRYVRNSFDRAKLRQSNRIIGLPIKELNRELFVLSGQDFREGEHE